MNILFFALAAAVAVLGALGVIIARTPVHSVLAMILNLIGLSLLYLTLHAEFMAVVQLIIYAGAIMVLFLFVIGLLTARKDPVERQGAGTLKGQRTAALVLGAGVAVLLGAAGLLFRGAAGAAPAAGFGTVKQFGELLLTVHVLPFELTAFVLMVAVIGVVILVGRKLA